jgi:hypothetical protein
MFYIPFYNILYIWLFRFSKNIIKKQEKQNIFQPRIIKLKLRETKENPTHQQDETSDGCERSCNGSARFGAMAIS